MGWDSVIDKPFRVVSSVDVPLPMEILRALDAMWC